MTIEQGFIELDELDFTASIEGDTLVIRAPWEHGPAEVSVGRHPEANFDRDCSRDVLYVTPLYKSMGIVADEQLLAELLNHWCISLLLGIPSNELTVRRNATAIPVSRKSVRESIITEIEKMQAGSNLTLQILNVIVGVYKNHGMDFPGTGEAKKKK